MEEGKKKIIMTVVILVCLVAAGIVTYSTRSSSKAGGIESIKRGTEMYWLKCRNPDCEHEWQMDKRDYYEYLNEHRREAPPMSVPPVVCPKCGEDSGYRAEKCEKCGLVFERGSVPNDLPDRCPKCGYSAIEEARKKARSKKKGE
jgi:predicted RNA-binding Zn-ribbon protein involved in translation (DUF1610 family)